MNELVLRSLLELVPPTATTLTEWWASTPQRTREYPVDAALIGGVLADRLGFAFAAGYSEALRSLVGELTGINSLCVTETGGNRPKDIATTLTAVTPGSYELTGRKKWATAGPLATTLLIAATTGLDEAGRNQLRLVKVPATARGVTMVASSAPFVPEIPHAEVHLDRVIVQDSDLLPGDGYDEYIKPFRTVEDAHVHAALLGYLIGVARRHNFSRELIELLLGAAIGVRELALADAKSPVTHLALAGTIALVTRLVEEVERAWAAVPDDEWQRWQRDRALMKVAGAARGARREAAWSMLAT